MAKVKVLVVEDEVIIADNLCDSLDEMGYMTFEPVASYTEALKSIEKEIPDIAILDIQLVGKKSGIELGKTIKEQYDFPFIFLTSNSDKMTFSQAKKNNPSAFLVKPFVKEEVYAAIELALFNFCKEKEKAIDKENLIIKNTLFIKQKQSFQRLNFSDIHYLKSDSNYIEIKLTNNKKYIVRGKLNDYLNKLDKQFARCHRSYIVNLEYLESIDSISLQSRGESIPIGKQYREEILQRLSII